MTDGVYSRDEIVSFRRGSHPGTDPRKPVPQVALCALALMLSTAVGLTLLYTKDKADPAQASIAIVAAPVPVAAPKPVLRQAASPAPMPAAIAPLRHYASMFDPNLTLNAAVLFAQPAPLKKAYAPVRNAVPSAPDVVAALETQPAPVPAAPAKIAVEAPDVSEMVPVAPVVSEIEVPLPTPRPAALMAAHDDIPRAAAARRIAQATEPPPPAVPAPAAQPSFFDRMFGQVKNPSNVLAYAAPEDGAIGGLGLGTGGPARPQAIDRYTAIYDISAHTVYLPDGTRLEAHSGVGPNKDDPRSVAARMRGVTPPNLYDLKEREAPFHGVRALRLNAVDGSVPYGRAGLLAHTYMLGPNGDSNGCVVFRDYRSFLAAYDSGAIRRLAVVARLN